MKRNDILLIPALMGIILAGCAKTVSTSTAEADKRYLEAWVEKWAERNHAPVPEASGNGIYILEDTEGTGAVVDFTDTPFIKVDFMVTDMEGNIASASSETIAKQLGTYSIANYYGPRFWLVEEGLSGVYAGVEDMLEGMREGGTRKALIPYWLCTTKRYANEARYMKEVTSGSNLIYTITLHEAIADMDEYEGKLLDAYSKANLGGADSTFVDGNEDYGKFGFYFVSRSSDTEVDKTYEMPADTTMYLNYTGRFLDGKVFDSTDEKIAKDAGIYSESRTYAPVEIKRTKEYTDIEMGGSSDLVIGFQAAIHMLHPMEKAVTAFYSLMGYGYSGNGLVIPPYSPLVFELELVEKP